MDSCACIRYTRANNIHASADWFMEAHTAYSSTAQYLRWGGVNLRQAGVSCSEQHCHWCEQQCPHDPCRSCVLTDNLRLCRIGRYKIYTVACKRRCFYKVIRQYMGTKEASQTNWKPKPLNGRGDHRIASVLVTTSVLSSVMASWIWIPVSQLISHIRPLYSRWGLIMMFSIPRG